MRNNTVNSNPFIIAYGKGGLEFANLDPERDALIFLTDPKDLVPTRVSDPGALPVLHLEFSDISDTHIPWIWRQVSNHCRTNSSVSFVEKRLSSDWPTIPFSPFHAQLILEFARGIGFNRNIHICCNYGRSRSVTIAQFLASFMFPGFELRISRTDSRINTRVHKIMIKEHLRC